MSCRVSSDWEGVRVVEGHVGVVVSVKQGPGPAQDWGRLGIIAVCIQRLSLSNGSLRAASTVLVLVVA